ncbi:zinc ribbon domain-containing protein [Propionimicrobium sp. BV2F7]|uniref:zinc ribbon domain-containing protein n=1 Tax=Propionimicrobium sp. BV2F7 TaxID=1111131 RepID=UPI000685556F|nr:zinc ribbon domain-containing protein [Propionimicrobium sp. BV2F7]
MVHELKQQISAQGRRMDYSITNFYLDNLAVVGAISCDELRAAQDFISAELKVFNAVRKIAGFGKPVSFGRQLSGRIECEDCGANYGHKTWHSGTPNRADVWECATNHKKRGSCVTPHIYQEILQRKLVESQQILAERHPDLRKRVVEVLREIGCAATSQFLHARMRSFERSGDAVLFFPDFLEILEGGMVLTSNQLGLVFITGEAVTLDLPQRWTPVLYADGLAATRH